MGDETMDYRGPWVRTASGRWDDFCETVQGFVEKNLSDFEADGERVRGYRSPDTEPIWIRDHTHQLKAAKYFEPDLQSTLDFFLKRQLPDGSFYERVDARGGIERVDCEADVEYHFVRAAYLAWQASGDDAWMQRRLSALEQGLQSCLDSPVRWSKEHRLIKRAFTIDTWDFQYLGCRDCRFKTRIGSYSRFGIMHGDNSGFYEACQFLARMLRHAGESDRARSWLRTARQIRRRMNRVCWNGTFYRHFLHIDPVEVSGVDEEAILSLSNAYDINRGAPTHEMAVSILDEYARRGRELRPRPFAEWFSVQPCLPGEGFGDLGHEFGDYRYINGAIMPFVGGELARAALEHGRERYGVRQLAKYAAMLRDTGQAYLCYHYDGTPDLYRPTITPHDGWGSAAMLYGLVEGLAGVEDEAACLRRVRLSPRWVAADEPWAEALVGYAASGAWLKCRFEHDAAAREIRLVLDGNDAARRIRAHVLLPPGSVASTVAFRGRDLRFVTTHVEGSPYVDFGLRSGRGDVKIRYDRGGTCREDCGHRRGEQ